MYICLLLLERVTLAKACIETIRKMQEEYGSKPENVKVALGPCIGPCCLEFDAKDAGLFTSINESCVIWKEGNSKPFVDLRLANRTLLESFGVLPNHIDDTTLTLCQTTWTYTGSKGNFNIFRF
jgi:copper oxidase (laccase) domain-containing protein